jgi:hypothetical protein
LENSYATSFQKTKIITEKIHMEINFNVYGYSSLKENEIPSHSLLPRKKKSG